MILRVCSSLLAAWLLIAAAEGAPLKPYRQGEWKALVAEDTGRPLIVHFWGVTCGPCMVELPKWGRFSREPHGAWIVFIEMDGAPEKAALRILVDAGLGGADIRALASPFDEFTRYEIDPRWAGELPSTVLIGSDGTSKRLSGAANFGEIRTWLKTRRAK